MKLSDMKYWIFSPPIEAHAELPVVENIGEFADQLVPDLSGNPLTWGPNFINWNLQNWIRVMDNVFGYHNYNSDTSITIEQNFFIAQASFNYSLAGQITPYTGIIYGVPLQDLSENFTVFNAPHFQINAVPTSGTSVNILPVYTDNGLYISVGNPALNWTIDKDYTSISFAVRFSTPNRTYYANTAPEIIAYQYAAKLGTVAITSNPNLHASHPNSILIDSGTYDYNNFKNAIINNFNNSHPDATLDPSDFPDFQQAVDEVHPEDTTEPTEPGGGGGNIYVENNGTIEGNFEAGAFGAGAIGWVDIDGELNAEFNGGVNLDGDLNFNGDVNFNGEMNNEFNGSVDFNGDLNLSGGDMNFSGDVTFGDVYVQGDTINYDEVLSERELESILNQETYYLAEVETGAAALTLQPAPEVFLPEKIVEAGAGMFSIGFSTLSDIGILTPFVSVAVFMFFIKTFRR